jgi:2'-5' RNA ligase
MFHRPVRVSHRLFFALRPPIAQARQIANAASWFETEGSPVAAGRLHVTMFILDDRFDLPASMIAALTGIGDAIAAAPVEIVLDRVGGGARSIALRPSRRIAALDALHRQLGERSRAAGIDQRAGYAFNPHMTLGYRDGRPFTMAVPPVAWTARELVLIHSHLGRTRHEVLGRWPLAAVDPQLVLFG